MENASKALIMAAGVLIGVLILALMVTLFMHSQDVFKTYEETKKTEQIQQFNTNFTKYVGQDLTIHQVVTICNFALQNGFEASNIIGLQGENQISKDITDINNLYASGAYEGKKIQYIYKLTINNYDNNGYVSKITFSARQLQVIDL